MRSQDKRRSEFLAIRRAALDKSVTRWLARQKWQSDFVDTAALFRSFNRFAMRYRQPPCTKRALSESLIRLGYRRRVAGKHRSDCKRGFVGLGGQE